MVNAINQSRTRKIECIPKDWQVLKLSEIGTFRKGKGIARKDLIEEGIPCVLYGEIYTKYHFTAHKLSSFITQETAEKAEIIQNGDILFTGSGETAEEIGKSFVYLGTKKAYAGGDITILSPQNGLPLFLGYITNSTIVNKQKEMHAQGSSVIHIYPKNLEQIKIPYPPIAEQQKIATALSDIDNLNESLEKVIAKKKKIKQGTMQQLLKGEKRLDNFNSEWKQTTLGQIGETYTGLSGKTKKDFLDGETEYIPFINVMNNTQIKEIELDKVRINKNEKQNKVKSGDLIFNTSSETPEEVGMCSVVTFKTHNLYLNSFCFGYRLQHQEYDPLFLSYFFRSLVGRNIIRSLAQGSTRYNLSKKSLLELELWLPKYEEQKAIAKILSDMDAEIEALESKLEKYKKLKEGMMQQLLTGRIRLV